MASSQPDLTLTPEDVEYLIAYLRTIAGPVSTADLLVALKNRQS
jgi:hypothetical protein